MLKKKFEHEKSKVQQAELRASNAELKAQVVENQLAVEKAEKEKLESELQMC